MFSSTPNIDDFLDAPWDTYEPYFKNLSDRVITDESVHQWLLDWTRLRDLIFEVRNRLYVAYNQNTANEVTEKRYHTFVENVFPPAMSAEQHLKVRLLETGLIPDGFQIAHRNMRAEADLFREENLPLKAKEQKLISEYEKISGGQSIIWEEKEYTIQQLQPLYYQSDRETRARIWQFASQRQLEDRDAINTLWRKFMDLRGKIAANAGLPNYRAYMWADLLRFDYTTEDCEIFHQAIEEVVVPAATRIYEKRSRNLGVKRLRPWDLDIEQGVYTFYVPPLHPYKDPKDLDKKASKMFHQVDTQLGQYFEAMRQENLLDLHNRMDKAPGGYCISFRVSKRPFIFMNAVGTHDDIQTILHEAGHAFHVFETNVLPYVQQREMGSEFAEVASMSMELLAAPYLLTTRGGFYNKEDAARARIEHLERSLLFWPYMAVVDAFQHWVYTNHEIASDPTNCDEKWDELWNRFIPGVDWSGSEEARKTGWHRKIHIHTDPFYYVEYGMASLGAFQVWNNALNDQEKAVKAYRHALSLGGTRPIPDLYQAAGARFAFDKGTVQEITDLIERKIAELESLVGN